MRELSVVIPAYNEEERIEPTLTLLTKNIKNLKEIIVVIDGNDNTADIAKSIDPKVKVLSSNHRLGKGGAVLKGFRAANSDVVCFVDADGSAPWYEVQRICNLVNDNMPCAIGSRWVKSSKVIKKEPLFNMFAGRVFHYIVYAILKVKVKDTQCGLKAFRGDIAKELANRVMVLNRAFDIALLYHIQKMGYHITEEGIEWSYHPETKMPILKAIPIMFLTSIGIWLSHFRFKEKTKKLVEKVSKTFEMF